jgi:hypothetical protein
MVIASPGGTQDMAALSIVDGRPSTRSRIERARRADGPRRLNSEPQPHAATFGAAVSAARVVAGV